MISCQNANHDESKQSNIADNICSENLRVRFNLKSKHRQILCGNCYRYIRIKRFDIHNCRTRMESDQKKKRVEQREKIKNQRKIYKDVLLNMKKQLKVYSEIHSAFIGNLSRILIERMNSINQFIKFQPYLLNSILHQKYQYKKQLGIDQIAVKGVKFVSSQDELSKLEVPQIFIYHCFDVDHFGTYIKCGNCQLVSYDGIRLDEKLYRNYNVRISKFIEAQEDVWSCGYKAYFWAQKISSIGLNKWLVNMQNRGEATTRIP